MKILIIGKDGGQRVRIKSLLKDVLAKATMDAAAAPQELLANKDLVFSEYLLIFASIDLGESGVTQLLEMATQVSPTFSKRIVLIVPPRSQSGNILTQWLQRGVGGFLFEPLSLDQISELVGRVAQNIVEHRTVDVASVSIKTDMMAAAALIDRLYKCEATGLDASLDQRKLDTIHKLLGEHFQSSPERYERYLIEIFSSVEPSVLKTPKVRRKQTTQIKVEHPGIEVFRLLQRRNISSERAQNLLSITEQELTLLCQGNFDVTPEMAERLARGFGGTKQTWLERQKQYTQYAKSINPDGSNAKQV
ncbi:MAG: hypothetical protein QY326_03950 [Bdellovibrionota bacterium]|nr:MAG: hypothetical protein QY326_03950 [Bdellovibrionota bacterium]